MAIFGSKKKTTKKATEQAVKAVAVVSENKATSIVDYSSILRRPRITEKASAYSDKGVYVFDVAQDANKRTIAAAVRALYNVTPAKIAVTAIPVKQVMIRGKWGKKGGGKKAYIYLNAGEKIELI